VARAFADTSGLLALAHSKDQHHAAAVRIARRHFAVGGRFVSTPMVLGELQSLLLYRRGPQESRTRIAALLADPGYEWVAVDGMTCDDATHNWLERFADQPFTLTDAISFETMRLERLTHAFSFDRDFETAGFKRLV
jgi:predicted nucleic acid-binding protein